MLNISAVVFVVFGLFLIGSALNSLPAAVSLFLLSILTIFGLCVLSYEFPLFGLALLVIFLLSIPSMIAACWRKMFPITEEQKNAARLAKNAQRRKNYKLKKEAKIAAASKALQPKHIY